MYSYYVLLLSDVETLRMEYLQVCVVSKLHVPHTLSIYAPAHASTS